MNTTTRTAYLDSLSINTMYKWKQSRHPRWYQPLIEFIKYAYMQFLLVTTLYIMEPWERLLMMSILLLVVSLVSYSTLVYIPFHLYHILQWIITP